MGFELKGELTNGALFGVTRKRMIEIYDKTKEGQLDKCLFLGIVKRTALFCETPEELVAMTVMLSTAQRL
jgi:hypothetical protein